MPWTAWIALKHALIVHLPIAAALMIPLPILAAQRSGRGIRPWWTTCRYLAWAGTLGSLLALGSGFLLAHLHGHLQAGGWVAPMPPGLPYLFRLHEAGGAASLVLGLLCLRALCRSREEHQGIGLLALLSGLAWCCVSFLSAYTGSVLVGQRPAPRSFLGQGTATNPQAWAPPPGHAPG